MQADFSLMQFWQQSDAISKSIALILLLMSLISWSVMLIKARQLWALRRPIRTVHAQFWHAQQFDQALHLLQTPAYSPFRQLAEEARNAVAHHAQHRGDLHDQLNISDWLSSCLRRSMDDATAHLQHGLAVLATIGSTAPFVGLLGTVWGIYHALVAISHSGNAGLEQVSGPIGEALVMTAFGLFVAIPAVMAYNALSRGNKAVVMRLASFAHDLHAYFITGARVSNGTATATATTGAV